MYIVEYNPYTQKFTFNKESSFIETLWTALYADNVSSTAKIVFATIVPHLYSEPLIFPTQPELAEAIRKSIPTVKRAIKELKAIKLIEVPEGLTGRENKYIIFEHGYSDLTFSDAGARYLETLLKVQPNVFSVSHKRAETETFDPIEATGIKNDTNTKEKEGSPPPSLPPQTPPSLSPPLLEKETAGKIPANQSSGGLTEKERRQSILTAQTTVNRASGYSQHDDDRTLTDDMKPNKPERLPGDVHMWTPKHFEKYFKDRFKWKFNKEYPIAYGKDVKLVKNLVEKTTDIEDIKVVIDFVLDNWDRMKEQYKLKGKYPTIGIIFSGWFATFHSLLLDEHPFDESSLDMRSGFKFTDSLEDLDPTKGEKP